MRISFDKIILECHCYYQVIDQTAALQIYTITVKLDIMKASNDNAGIYGSMLICSICTLLQ